MEEEHVEGVCFEAAALLGTGQLWGLNFHGYPGNQILLSKHRSLTETSFEVCYSKLFQKELDVPYCWKSCDKCVPFMTTFKKI